jgi:hypothetical protein
MDFSLPADLWNSVIPISVLVGAAGGLAWDIGNAVRPSKSDPKTGLDNTLELPRIYKAKNGGWAIDLGLLGPILVGAVAGVLLVLLVGPSAPSAEEAAKAVVAANTATPAGGSGGGGDQGPTEGGGAQTEAGSETAAPTPAEATKAAEENLSSEVGAAQLVILALLGGLGGWALLQTLTTKMSSLLEAAVGKTVDHASKAAEEAVLREAEAAGVADEGERKKLAKLAGKTVKEAGATALHPDAPAAAGG